MMLYRMNLLPECRTWRKAGDRVVLTNGCFDLLHCGHCHGLRQAAAFGDRLVVAMNSDASARRLKGPERPLIPERLRAQMLSDLRYVDAVVIFDDDTPEAVIRAVRPDVLVKGNDWSGREVAGGKFVESYGGCVRFVSRLEGFSTTAIEDRLR